MDLKDGESTTVKGSAKDPYVIKNTGGVYSCSCPAWRNQSQPIERRTCKHIRKVRGDAAETERIGGSITVKAAKTKDKVTAVPPALLLAEKWTTETDPKGWWMSEKLDGVRAYWDGTKLITRLGNPIHAPEWFTKDLPNKPLDGELFVARKTFQETVSIVRRQDKPETWTKVKYLVFDMPAEPGTFKERDKTLREVVAKMNVRHVVRVSQIACDGYDHLQRFLDKIHGMDGEGVMLRDPNSQYEGNRSQTLLKVKTFLDDEATVTGYEKGKGRHLGRVGAVEVTWRGKKFKCGTGLSDKERENPPAIGSKVSFKYQELSSDGIPRFPVYMGQRIDK